MPKYFVTEPSPSITSYIHCGRGGAGNTFIFRASSSSSFSSSSKPTKTNTHISSSRRFFSGIGGAGNIHAASDLPSATESLDDAVRHASARDHASIGFCGRGGAGNVYRRKDSDATSLSVSSAGSIKSNLSSTAKVWNRLSGSFSRG